VRREIDAQSFVLDLSSLLLGISNWKQPRFKVLPKRVTFRPSWRRKEVLQNMIYLKSIRFSDV
jgi:hypothetical protein